MLKYFNPTTPSQRKYISIDKKFLTKKTYFPNLRKGFKRSFGRNNQGRITSIGFGGGHKRLYRQITFNRQNIKGFIKSIEYDPNRTAFIAAIQGKNIIDQNYILLPDGMKIGDYLNSGPSVDIIKGNALPLKNIPIGSIIHNISLRPNSEGKLTRSAGTSSQLLQKTSKGFAIVRLSSGELYWVPLLAYATLGMVSNYDHKNRKYGKAGRSRWLNKRPKVRGVAKNPVDHPHGGGEGKTSGGRPSVTPSGRPTKGQLTRKRNYKIKKN